MPTKYRIAFYTEGLPIDLSKPIENMSLGGSETALYYLATELAKRSHYVDVYCQLQAPVTAQGVNWYPFSMFAGAMVSVIDYDVLVSHRYHMGVINNISDADVRMKIFWNHDMPVPNKEYNAGLAFYPNKMVFLSEFHKKEYAKWLVGIDRVAWVSKNGIDKTLGDKYHDRRVERLNAAKTLHPMFVYGSRPERGLRILLQRIWPEILKKLPTAQLIITGYSFNDAYVNPSYKETYRQVSLAFEKFKNMNITVMKDGTKEEWYSLLSHATAMLYPCMFPEISCINAIEAQYIGTPIITTDNWALSETVKHKYSKIDLDPFTKEYVDEFVRRTMGVVQEEPLLAQEMVAVNKAHVDLSYTWETIAEDWEREIAGFFEYRYKTRSEGIILSFLEKDDLVSARKVIEDIESVYPNLTDYQQELKDVIQRRFDDADVTQGVKDPLAFDKLVILDRYKVMLDHIKTSRKHATMLDIGCGYGEFTGYVSTQLPDTKITALDFDTSYAKTYFEKNSLKTDNITLQDVDLYALLTHLQPRDGVFGQKYDVVVLGEVLEHFPDPVALLELVESFVAEKGMVVISVPTGYWMDSHHLQSYRFSDLKAMMGHKDSFRYTHLAVSKGQYNLRVGNYVLSYTYDSSKKIYPIDYDHKIRTEVPRETVSFCMMVKNESENLMRVLNTAYPHFDEYVITDNGSTDSTKELLKNLEPVPAMVKTSDFEWNGRFDDARNFMVKEAVGDWIFWMDADEILCSPEEIRKYLYSSYYVGYSVSQVHVVADRDQTEDYPLRLYRNQPDIKFYGVIHEMPMFGINTPVEPQMNLAEVRFMHMGYLTESQRRNKGLVRNLPLLKKDREIFPERILGVGLIMRDLLHLGRWELEAKQGNITRKGYEYYQRVIRIFRKYFKDEKDETLRKYPYEVYQQALKEMAIAGIYVEDSGILPIEIIFGLKGGVGGVVDPNLPQLDSFWIGFPDELEKHMMERKDLLIKTCEASVDRFIEPVFVEAQSNLYAHFVIEPENDVLKENKTPEKLSEINEN